MAGRHLGRGLGALDRLRRAHPQSARRSPRTRPASSPRSGSPSRHSRYAPTPARALPGFAALGAVGIAVFFLRERLTRWRWAGGISGSLAGAALIAAAATSAGQAPGLGVPFGPGAALVLLAAACQSVHLVAQKRYLRVRPAAGANPYRSFELTAYAVWAGALLLAPLLPGALARAFAGATGTVSANAAATGAAAYLGLFPGALAYVAYTHALARLPAARATSFL